MDEPLSLLPSSPWRSLLHVGTSLIPLAIPLLRPFTSPARKRFLPLDTFDSGQLLIQLLI